MLSAEATKISPSRISQWMLEINYIKKELGNFAMNNIEATQSTQME